MWIWDCFFVDDLWVDWCQGVVVFYLQVWVVVVFQIVVDCVVIVYGIVGDIIYSFGFVDVVCGFFNYYYQFGFVVYVFDVIWVY